MRWLTAELVRWLESGHGHVLIGVTSGLPAACEERPESSILLTEMGQVGG